MAVEDTWLARYLAGEQDQVWHELRQLGGRVRRKRYFGAAQGVCDEMARRCRHNVEVIVDRLEADGFRFHSNDDDQRPVAPFLPATGQAAERAAVLERRFGEQRHPHRFGRISR